MLPTLRLKPVLDSAVSDLAFWLGIKNPTGLFLDSKNNELWVTNFGNHTVTVYPSGAGGDTPPLRTIRSAPMGEPSLMIGNPGAVEFDTKRKEILVPN